MKSVNFNITDISTGQKLEALLLRINKEIETAKQDYMARMKLLQSQIEGLSVNFSTSQARLASVEGAYATVFRTSPADVQVYDEQNQQWITTSGTSTSFAGDLLPTIDGTYNLGSSTYEWQNLFIDGTANIDALAADGLTVVNDIVTGAASTYYLGAIDTDGTWKIVRSGTDLEIRRREAGVYNLKATVIA